MTLAKSPTGGMPLLMLTSNIDNDNEVFYKNHAPDFLRIGWKFSPALGQWVLAGPAEEPRLSIGFLLIPPLEEGARYACGQPALRGAGRLQVPARLFFERREYVHVV